jgi:hypothetical protein
MELTGYASIFISYFHTNSSWMERFRKELRAALYRKATVWCDKDISGGTDWKDRLAVELHRADVALILATTDYLESEWCRRELQYICGKFREKRIKNVFWVQLEPCAWKQTELAGFQSKSSGRPLSDLDDRVREREIIDLVGEICSAVGSITASLDPQLTFVQSMLGDEALQRHLSIESLISNEGDFAVVCRGRDGSQRDVAIKVLRQSPFTGILENLEKTAERRRQLRDPGFIRLYDSFIVKSPHGKHLVLVMEYFHGKRLCDAMRDKALKGRFTTDGTVTLIRRAAEALKELHELECGPDSSCDDIKELGYGPMIPEHLFYDERLERLRFSALSISNFAWDVLGWRSFAAYVSPDAARYTAPEQIVAQPAGAKIDKRKLDQYMLGQLAVEMLDGRLPVERDAAEDIGEKKAEMFDGPLKNAGRWKSTNPQLEQIVSRMLWRDQGGRWEEMGKIVTQLTSVEGEARALAKSSYMRWIDGDERFFEEFYGRFFASKVARRENSEGKFQDRVQQHDKLRKGMAAVLNFYPGNEPTSLRYVIEGHRNKGVTEDELNQFKSCFLEMLKDRLDSGVALGDEMADGREAVYQAWQDLFEQVLSYFREQGINR